MVSGWALIGNIGLRSAKMINSQRGHEELVHSKATKAAKYRVFTEANEANEGLLMLCVLGPGSPLLPSVKNPSVFVAFVALL